MTELKLRFTGHPDRVSGAHQEHNQPQLSHQPVPAHVGVHGSVLVKAQRDGEPMLVDKMTKLGRLVQVRLLSQDEAIPASADHYLCWLFISRLTRFVVWEKRNAERRGRPAQ